MTGDIITSKFPTIKYIRTKKNLGVSARNISFNEAKGDIIITIDDDIFGLSDADINALVSYFTCNINTGALNFKVIDDKTKEVCNWIHHRKVEDYHDKNFLTYEITEGAVAFNKKALILSGHYPEYFFLSHEGPDLAFRILDTGYEVWYSSLVSVLHSHAQEGRKSWFRYYYDTRNQFLLAMRNFPILYAVNFLIKGLLSTFFYALRDGFLKYWAKGVFDGIKGMVQHSCDRKVISQDTMSLLRAIDKERPSFLYMVKKRIFRTEMRL
jgi:GT2 family glycosyltransferase